MRIYQISYAGKERERDTERERENENESKDRNILLMMWG